MKPFVISSLFIASSIFGLVSTASAESLVVATVSNSGEVYEVDLDNRIFYNTDAGWRHVKFWLSTKGDPEKYPAVASCAPYQIYAPHYGWDWLPSGGGYPEGTVGGEIARVACND